LEFSPHVIVLFSDMCPLEIFLPSSLKRNIL